MAYLAHAYDMERTELCKATTWHGKLVMIKPEEQY